MPSPKVKLRIKLEIILASCCCFEGGESREALLRGAEIRWRKGRRRVLALFLCALYCFALGPFSSSCRSPFSFAVCLSVISRCRSFSFFPVYFPISFSLVLLFFFFLILFSLLSLLFILSCFLFLLYFTLILTLIFFPLPLPFISLPLPPSLLSQNKDAKVTPFPGRNDAPWGSSPGKKRKKVKDKKKGIR